MKNTLKNKSCPTYSLTPKVRNEEFTPDNLEKEVMRKISFHLSQSMWQKIDEAFAYCWNNEIGVGNDIYEGQIEYSIYRQLKAQHILISYERIEIIVAIIYEYLKTLQGALLNVEN